MKKNAKKYMKTIFIGVVLVALGLGYYFYLSNRETPAQTTERKAAEEEYNAIANKNLNEYYPESPKEVLKLYARITKAFYKAPLTDEQIETLGKQARTLFDDELYRTQTDEEYFEALKKDIEEYKKLKRYVADYTIDESTEVDYKPHGGKEYATINVVYTIREGANLIYSDTKFTMRQDEQGNWKILFWALDKDKNKNAE